MTVELSFIHVTFLNQDPAATRMLLPRVSLLEWFRAERKGRALFAILRPLEVTLTLYL